MLLAVISTITLGWAPPYGVPTSFDCETRKLAYIFGRELVPRRGSFESLWYALDLAGNDTSCVVPLPPTTPATASLPSAEKMWPSGAFFVDANNGADHAKRGAIEVPLRTIQAALDRIASTQSEVLTQPTIVLRGGTHFIASTLLIGPEHSGLEIIGHPNERSVVSGGVPLQNLAWTEHDVNNETGANIWKTQVDARFWRTFHVIRADDTCSVLGDMHGISGDDIGGVPATTVEACSTVSPSQLPPSRAAPHPGATWGLFSSHLTELCFSLFCFFSFFSKACCADVKCAAAVWAAEQNACYKKGANYQIQSASSGSWVVTKGPSPSPPAPTPPGPAPPTPTPPTPTPKLEDMPGLHIDGVRATIARYPNHPGGVEHSCMGGCVVGQGDVTWTPADFAKLGNATDYTDRIPAHKRNDSASGWSQYDNWFAHYMLGIGGACQVYDPPVSYWCNSNASGGGAFPFHTPSGFALNEDANAVLPNAPYADTSQATLFVWHPLRWANWMFDVGAYDASTGNFTFGRGGNQGARGADKGGDFYIQDVFEELDYPGEYFYNTSTKTLYLNYNASNANGTVQVGTPPPSTLKFVVPQQQTLVKFIGTQSEPVRDVKLTNIEYTASAPTYMERHAVPSAGDWALDRFAAVFLQGTIGATITKCNFTRLDGNALMLSGFNRNTTITDSGECS